MATPRAPTGSGVPRRSRQFRDGRPFLGDRGGADPAGLAGRWAARDAQQMLPVARQCLAAGQRNDLPGPRGQQPRRFRWHAGRQLAVQRRAEYPRAHPVGGAGRPQAERIAEQEIVRARRF